LAASAVEGALLFRGVGEDETFFTLPP
jgi:hypothetical protein